MVDHAWSNHILRGGKLEVCCTPQPPPPKKNNNNMELEHQPFFSKQHIVPYIFQEIFHSRSNRWFSRGCNVSNSHRITMSEAEELNDLAKGSTRRNVSSGSTSWLVIQLCGYAKNHVAKREFNICVYCNSIAMYYHVVMKQVSSKRTRHENTTMCKCNMVRNHVPFFIFELWVSRGDANIHERWHRSFFQIKTW